MQLVVYNKNTKFGITAFFWDIAKPHWVIGLPWSEGRLCLRLEGY